LAELLAKRIRGATLTKEALQEIALLGGEHIIEEMPGHHLGQDEGSRVEEEQGEAGGEKERTHSEALDIAVFEGDGRLKEKGVRL